jgi:hypothetical protein
MVLSTYLEAKIQGSLEDFADSPERDFSLIFKRQIGKC